MRGVRVTDDEEEDPEQDHKGRNNVHEVLDFSVYEITALDVVNGAKRFHPGGEVYSQRRQHSSVRAPYPMTPTTRRLRLLYY